MLGRMSRRHFLATATLSVTANPVAACRWRHSCCVVSTCPPLLDPVIGLRVRPNILSLSGPQLESLKHGVVAMNALPPTDRRSWAFQAAIHGTDDESYTNPLFNQCAHSSPNHVNLEFFPWHRAYVYFFERILRWAADDPTLMLPFWDWAAYPVLPFPFRYPADELNSLYEEKRKANDGAPGVATH
jgi:hypothetical protein